MTARGYIVTATDTGVGKTVFAAALARAIDGQYWKPVQAGTDAPTDRDVAAALSGLAPARFHPEVYRLRMPASPHIAASAENRTLNMDRLKQLPTAEPLVIEGAGGVLVPLTDSDLQIDLFAAWSLPVIVCARTTLGTINHTLLTLEALRNRDIPCAGLAFIGDANEPVETTIERLSATPRLGRLPILDPLTPERLHGAFSVAFDIGGLRAGKPARYQQP